MVKRRTRPKKPAVRLFSKEQMQADLIAKTERAYRNEAEQSRLRIVSNRCLQGATVS